MQGAPRFFVEPGGIVAGEVTFSGDEVRHASVLRLQKGNPVELFDGTGVLASGNISEISRRKVVATVTSLEKKVEPLSGIVVASAVPKGKRMHTLVEKCTETGAAVIQPVNFRYSVARCEGDSGKMRRWAIEASKQCKRLVLPETREPVTLEEALFAHHDCAKIYLSRLGGNPSEILPDIINRSPVVILVGPEAGLSPEEEKMCLAHGFVPMSLGNMILRTETAAIVGVATVHCMLNAIYS